MRTIEQMINKAEKIEKLIETAKTENNVSLYYEAKEWVEKFYSILNSCTCYPEHRREYKDGITALDLMCNKF